MQVGVVVVVVVGKLLSFLLIKQIKMQVFQAESGVLYSTSETKFPSSSQVGFG